ncbi:hypothetical protein ABIE49_001990 [Bradyrhizobium sp. OAE829]
MPPPAAPRCSLGNKTCVGRSLLLARSALASYRFSRMHARTNTTYLRGAVKQKEEERGDTVFLRGARLGLFKMHSSCAVYSAPGVADCL